VVESLGSVKTLCDTQALATIPSAVARRIALAAKAERRKIKNTSSDAKDYSQEWRH
jgi:hypothetical protein